MPQWGQSFHKESFSLFVKLLSESTISFRLNKYVVHRIQQLIMKLKGNICWRVYHLKKIMKLRIQNLYEFINHSVIDEKTIKMNKQGLF